MWAHENKDGNGMIVSHHGLIREPSQSIVGYVSENGILYDDKNNLLGFVSQQGNVRDVKLRLIGHVNIQEHSFPYDAGRAAFFLFIKAEGV